MDSLTQNCGGSLIRTISLGPTDTRLDPFLWFFHNGWRWKFWFTSTQMDSLTQNCGGSLIRTFPLGPTDTKLDPFLWFFIMAEGEILISVDVDVPATCWRTTNLYARGLPATRHVTNVKGLPATWEFPLSNSCHLWLLPTTFIEIWSFPNFLSFPRFGSQPPCTLIPVHFN